MSVRIRHLLSLVLLAALVVIAVRYVDFSLLRRLPPIYVLFLLFPVSIALWSRAYVIQIVVLRAGLRLTAREWLGLSLYSWLANLVLPFRSGFALKAAYLKRIHFVRYADFIGIQGGLGLVHLITGAAFSLAVVVLIPPLEPRMAVPLAGLLIVLLVPFAFTTVSRDSENKWIRALFNSYNSFQGVRGDLNVLGIKILNSLITLLSTAAALWLALQGLGADAGPAQAIFMTVSLFLVNLVNLTPGNFGVQELTSGMVARYVELDFELGLLAVLLVRIFSVMVQLIAAPFFLDVLRKVAPDDG